MFDRAGPLGSRQPDSEESARAAVLVRLSVRTKAALGPFAVGRKVYSKQMRSDALRVRNLTEDHTNFLQ